jgi:hypothetical protein
LSSIIANFKPENISQSNSNLSDINKKAVKIELLCLDESNIESDLISHLSKLDENINIDCLLALVYSANGSLR